MLFDCVIGTSGFGLSLRIVHSVVIKPERFSYRAKSRRSLGGVLVEASVLSSFERFL